MRRMMYEEERKRKKNRRRFLFIYLAVAFGTGILIGYLLLPSLSPPSPPPPLPPVAVAAAAGFSPASSPPAPLPPPPPPIERDVILSFGGFEEREFFSSNGMVTIPVTIYGLSSEIESITISYDKGAVSFKEFDRAGEWSVENIAHLPGEIRIEGGVNSQPSSGLTLVGNLLFAYDGHQPGSTTLRFLDAVVFYCGQKVNVIIDHPGGEAIIIP